MDQQTKAALKRNDYLTVNESGLQFSGLNRRSAMVSAAALLAVIVVAVLAIVLYQNRSEKASEAFGAAMQTYQTPLAAPGQAVPPGVKTFATVADRAKASSNQFMQVANQYSSTPDGKNARYFAGLTYIEAGQNATAEETLKKVAGGWNRDLGDLAKLALAQMYRQTARDAQAVDLYNQIAAKPSTSVPAGVAKLQLADLYMGENKPDQARKIYAELKDKDGKSAAGIIAAQKLNPGAAPAPQM